MAETLAGNQKTLGGEPVVTLTIGSHSLDAFVWGYRYEEAAEAEGGLTLWLENRDDEFDDLGTDYPDLVRGAAVDLRRGLPVDDVDTTEKLPRTWIEELRYEFRDGVALLRLECIDWRGLLKRFRYDTKQEWTSTEVATIASSILSEVGLTLASGTFSFSTDLTVSVRRDTARAIKDLMGRVEEYLYAGEDGEIQHKELDPSEAAGYNYDWSAGGGANHPLLVGTEIAESSPLVNTVQVIGGEDGEYSGSAADSDEVDLVGTRRRTLTDDSLSSDAQCAEQAQAELRGWQAGSSSGVVVARPHFTLRLYDVVSVAAPPYGGPALTGRVMGYIEDYGRGEGLWQQRIRVGSAAGRASASVLGGLGGEAELGDGVVTGKEIDAQPVAAGRYQIRDADTSDILLSLSAEEDLEVGTTSTLEIRGKNATSPEGAAELVAITHDGLVHGGVASVVITLETETGVIEFTGATRMRMGTTYIEMTEQAADPDAPGVNRVRVYARDDGEGNTQLCARFNTGDIDVLAEQDTTLDDRYVEVAGDIMTGGLDIRANVVEALVVRQDAATTTFQVDATMGGFYLTQLGEDGGLTMTYGTNDAIAFEMISRKHRATAIVQDDDSLLDLRARGFDGTGYVDAAQILMEVDGTPGVDDMPGRIVFSTTADGAAAVTERMRIDSAGLVSVTGGVLVTVGAEETLRAYRASGGGTVALFEMGSSAGVLAGIKNTDREWGFGMDSAERFVIRDVTGSAEPVLIEAGAPDNSFIIDSSGKLGWGIASPGGDCHVKGRTAWDANGGSPAGQDNIFLEDTAGTPGSGNFGASIGFTNIAGSGRRAAIAAVQTAADGDQMGIAFFTHPTATGSQAMQEAARFDHEGNLQLAEGRDLIFGTTTGSMIGTAAAQKLAFFGATPVVQRAKADYNNWAAFTDVVDALVALGLFDAA